MTKLELLAPARNADIGIAATNCGADAVYIAGPRFGARQAAGNSVEDIGRLCSYAHRFGVRIFVTLNTILYEEELQQAEELLRQVRDAGADAVIVQDMAVVEMARRVGMPIHASTQCAIRTPETAKMMEQLGFERIVTERQLSLRQIKEIVSAVNCEIESFVHGALCVCYSGNCYLSELLAGRSANRGDCIQACRSRYDLTDSEGNVLAKGKALLSLKDLNLLTRLGDLADAGVTSFKIEGRMKNMSYVKNTVQAYSIALDRIVDSSSGKYCRASFGRVSGGFSPDTDKTFNRGYTDLFIDGRRGKWASMEATKSIGKEIGTVTNISREHNSFVVRPISPDIRLSNGDGLTFTGRGGEVEGVRADVCEGLRVRCKPTPSLHEGARLFRNYDIEFERRLEAEPCVRRIGVGLEVSFWEGGAEAAGVSEGVAGAMVVSAVSEDGRKVERRFEGQWSEWAKNVERMEAMIGSQLSKSSGIYGFKVSDVRHSGRLPLISAAGLNALRHEMASELDALANGADRAADGVCDGSRVVPEQEGQRSVRGSGGPGSSGSLRGDRPVVSYKGNVSNSEAEKLYSVMGLKVTEPAYELTHRAGAELMRSKYCLRYELGLCPKQHRGKAEPLYLVNNGRKLEAAFDCAACEMIIRDAE